DGATLEAGRIAGDDAVRYGHHRHSRTAHVVDAAAVGAGRGAQGRVVADGTVVDLQCRAAVIESVVFDATGVASRRVASYHTVANRQHCMIVPDAGALVGWVRPGSEPVCDRQARSRGGYVGENVEHAGCGVTIDGEIGWAGPVDRNVMGDLKF